MSNRKSKFKVRLYLHTEEEGGRPKGIKSGFRCPVRFEDEEGNRYWTVSFNIPDNYKELSPGQEADVEMDILVAEKVDPMALTKGSEFSVGEGHIIIGHGTILK